MIYGTGYEGYTSVKLPKIRRIHTTVFLQVPRLNADTEKPCAVLFCATSPFVRQWVARRDSVAALHPL
jgi:hypothetical protein